MNDRLTRCRYTNRLHDPCPNEAFDPDADLVLCSHHTAAALTLAQALTDRHLEPGTPRTVAQLTQAVLAAAERIELKLNAALATTQ